MAAYHPTNTTPPAKANGNAPVVYIHPAKQGIHFEPEKVGRPYGVIPVGIAAIVNQLRANGIQTHGVNYPLEKQRNPKFDLSRWLAGHRGLRAVLIDMHWYEHTYGAIEVARLCKQTAPWVYTILGGLTASGFAREIIETIPEVDFVVRGDGEKPMLELARKLLQPGIRAPQPVDASGIPNITYRVGGEVIETPLAYTATDADLDALNFTDLSFLDHASDYFVHEYIVTDIAAARRNLELETPYLGRWLCTARGCRYHCSYCGGSKEAHKRLAGRSGLVVRSPHRIADDLQALESQGVIQASMSYDIAEMGEDYWKTLFTQIREKKIHIGLYNEFFQNPDPAFIRAFAQTAWMKHSCLAISPLSGNERVRRLNGKHYSTEALMQTLALLKEINCYIFVYFSLNLPGETNETVLETIELAKNIYEMYPHPLLKILNTVHTMDPLAPMNIHPMKYGIYSTMSRFGDYYNYCRETQVAQPEARTGKWRGIEMQEADARSLDFMANAWDQARRGREESWWPIPPGW